MSIFKRSNKEDKKNARSNYADNLPIFVETKEYLLPVDFFIDSSLTEEEIENKREFIENKYTQLIQTINVSYRKFVLGLGEVLRGVLITNYHESDVMKAYERRLSSFVDVCGLSLVDVVYEIDHLHIRDKKELEEKVRNHIETSPIYGHIDIPSNLKTIFKSYLLDNLHR